MLVLQIVSKRAFILMATTPSEVTNASLLSVSLSIFLIEILKLIIHTRKTERNESLLIAYQLAQSIVGIHIVLDGTIVTL